MLSRCCIQYASKFGKLSSSHRTGKGVFISILKKGNAKECSNYHTIALISHAIKVMLKILHLGINSMWTENFQMNKLDFKKTEEPEIKLLTSVESSKKQEIRRKHLLLLHWMHKGLCVDHNKLWEILQEKGIPDPLYCLLRNLYIGQEATVRTGHGTMDWFQIGKGVCEGCIFSPCSFNLYSEYIMQNAVLGESQAGIKIAKRTIKILRYADAAAAKSL